MRRRHGRIAIALAALVAGGCGSSSEDEPKRVSTAPATTATTATPATTARTSTTPRSTSGNGKGTATTTKPTPTPTTTPPPTKTTRAPSTQSTPAKLGKPQTFSGDGDRAIGRLVLKRNAVVRWTVTGGAFAVRDGGDRLKISGRGKSGQTFAEAGDYRSVKVTASGRWTLSFATLGA